jgi:hypothetical protein
MESEFFGTWKRTLEIQGSRRSAEHVPPEVAGRSAETDYLTYDRIKRSFLVLEVGVYEYYACE